MSWPTVELDRVQRLRVLSRVLPGVALEERTISAPFDAVWDFVSDLERAVPQFDRDVESLEIVERDGERLTIRSKAPHVPWPITLDAELSEGWCWMVARPQVYVVGMAAEPLGDHTRFAMLEGFSISSPAFLRGLLAPVGAVSAWRHRRHVPHDVNGIERALGLR